MKNKIATIIGGSGFVGSYIVKELMNQGYLVQILSRNPSESAYLKTAGQVGQLYLKAANIKDINLVKQSIKTSEVVINLVGILHETNKQSFYKLHTLAPKILAKTCKELSIKTFIHFSALGVDKAACSNYARTKYAGEKEALKANPNTIIFRPSVIFGKNDKFINKFIKYMKFSPILPLIKQGLTNFQPVYVEDIAKAVGKVIQHPQKFYGKTLELAGSKIYSFREIVHLVQERINKNCSLINIPEKINLIIAFFLEFTSSPLLTRDQIRLLRYPNTISTKSPYIQFKDLKISPKSLDEMFSMYKI